MTGLILSVVIAWFAPNTALGETPGPVESFRHAVWGHAGLLCGAQLTPAHRVRYRIEVEPGQDSQALPQRFLEILRRRVDDWSGPSPEIYLSGREELTISYPGAPESARLMRELLERPGILGFHEVDHDSPWVRGLGEEVGRWRAARGESTLTLAAQGDAAVAHADHLEELEAFVASLPPLPAGRIPGVQESRAWDGGPEATRWDLLILMEDAPVHGGQISSAEVITDSMDNQPRISLAFNDQGAAAFGDLSEALTNRYLAIVLDGRVMSAPRVMERIDGGRAQITMGAGRSYQETFDNARSLAAVLAAGAHPARLVMIEDQGPEPSSPRGWSTLGPLPLTAHLLAVLIVLRYGCM